MFALQENDALVTGASQRLGRGLAIMFARLCQARTALRFPLDDYRRGKLQVCRYFFRWELLKVHVLAERLAAFGTTALEMEETWL